MIVARAPLRISFVGGGTDLPDFYRRSPGRVISSAIDKFVYVVVNRTPLIDKVSARYSIAETVGHPSELQHTRIRAALLDLGIEKNVEIASFASLPSKTGLGSSSSFSVSLLNALGAYLGKKMKKEEIAAAASRLEIELVGEPIGKQDQYAAAMGGLNVIEFNPDESVVVEPVLLDFKKQLAFEDHLFVFFTGITRLASSVLSEQKKNTPQKLDVLKKMADSVYDFRDRLLLGDFAGLGRMLHEAWLMKKGLAAGVSSGVIDRLYDAGMGAGAWGGKVLGAGGGGGCVMFLVPPEKKAAVRAMVSAVAKENGLGESREIPVRLVQSGTEILYKSDDDVRFA